MRNKTDVLRGMIESLSSPRNILDYIYKNEHEIDFSYIDAKGNSFAHKALILSEGLGSAWAYGENVLLQIVPELFKRNLENINAKNNEEETLIDLAATTRQSMKLLKILLENGADINQTKSLKKVKESIEICRKVSRNTEGSHEYHLWATAQRELYDVLINEIEILMNKDHVTSYPV